MILNIRSKADLTQYLDQIDARAEQAVLALSKYGSAKATFRAVKFDEAGFHPIDGRPLNFIEQVNQTFTFMVALRATAWLLDRHPEAGGFRLAPGASMALPLDIMSEADGVVCAETFAATHPNSNRKLAKDLLKLKRAEAQFRYAFFYSPNFPFGRVQKLEREPGIEVHCIEI